ncbi:MAG: hypothetical protein IJ047_06095 [Paludibacteraceae bacterium]|nr:hypothetical protein [Paludibacteraceae bacterium]
MKRLLLVLCISLPFAAYADIIVTRSNGNIEDVKVESITPENVLYTQDGQAKSIQSADVEGVLYDDGRYVTPPSASQVQEQPMNNTGHVGWDDGSGQAGNNQSYGQYSPSVSVEYSESRGTNDFNILAYGKPVLNFYAADHDYDGATVEYRAITRSNPNPEFEYLGTTPFAYVTETEAKILSAFDKKVASIISIRPLSAEKGAKLEFRISKNGSSVIVRPMVKVDFGGRMIMLPLNKLKKGRLNVSNNNKTTNVALTNEQYSQLIMDLESYSKTHPTEWDEYCKNNKLAVKLNKNEYCFEQGTIAYQQAILSGLSGDAAIEALINTYTNALNGSSEQPMPVNPYSGGGTTGGDNW